MSKCNTYGPVFFLYRRNHRTFISIFGYCSNVNDSAVMQNTVRNGRGDGDVGKDLVPLGEGLIGGKDGGGLLIPLGVEVRWVFPTPDGPRNTTFSPFSRKRTVASSSIRRLLMEGWNAKSKLSRAFLIGKPDIWICFS